MLKTSSFEKFYYGVYVGYYEETPNLVAEYFLLRRRDQRYLQGLEVINFAGNNYVASPNSGSLVRVGLESLSRAS